MTSFRRLAFTAAMAAGLANAAPADAAQPSFSYKGSYQNVTKDPDGVWSDKELQLPESGHVRIYEYQLDTQRGKWLISQIWNADCSAATCPTRLVFIAADGRRKVLVDDMMHQVIPPDDPRFAGLAKSNQQAAFARRPFMLDGDDKTLVNGDFRFAIGAQR